MVSYFEKFLPVIYFLFNIPVYSLHICSVLAMLLYLLYLPVECFEKNPRIFQNCKEIHSCERNTRTFRSSPLFVLYVGFPVMALFMKLLPNSVKVLRNHTSPILQLYLCWSVSPLNKIKQVIDVTT